MKIELFTHFILRCTYSKIIFQKQCFQNSVQKVFSWQFINCCSPKIWSIVCLSLHGQMTSELWKQNCKRSFFLVFIRLAKSYFLTIKLMHKTYFNFPALFLGSRWEITFIVFWNRNYKRFFLKKAHKIKLLLL